jgi:hypothetical protein
MARLLVQPRETPAERAGEPVEIEVDDGFSAYAALLEDRVTPCQGWELMLREGHVLEEEDGIAKLARLTANGLDVELFHVLTFT